MRMYACVHLPPLPPHIHTGEQHTHACMNTRAHTHSLSFSHTHTHSPSLFLTRTHVRHRPHSLSLTHTHTHTHKHIHTTHSLSPTQTHHAHSHTHACVRAHTHTHTHKYLDQFGFGCVQDSQDSLDLMTLDLIYEVVELGHSLLPVLQLSTWPNVISLSPHLLTLCQHLFANNTKFVTITPTVETFSIHSLSLSPALSETFSIHS